MGCTCSTELDGQPPMNPSRVDHSHFTFLKVVGRGAFGKVNAVLHRGTNELLAVKRMNKRITLHKDPRLKTVKMERYVLSRVKSPFCLQLICAFQNEFELCFVLPFLKGGDLRYYLTQNKRMNEDMARFYAAEILLGISDLHSLNVIHRDLKPENIMFRENGHIVVTDYGIAKKLDASGVTCGKAGTQGYQAPEINGNYSFSVDLYSFAVILFEMVIGVRPVNAFPLFNKMSPELADLLQVMLQEDISKRYKGGQRVVEIMSHPWFSKIDFAQLAELKIPPPFAPSTEVANFSNASALEEALLGDIPEIPIRVADQVKFMGLEYMDDLKADNSEATKKFRQKLDSNLLLQNLEEVAEIQPDGSLIMRKALSDQTVMNLERPNSKRRVIQTESTPYSSRIVASPLDKTSSESGTLSNNLFQKRAQSGKGSNQALLPGFPSHAGEYSSFKSAREVSPMRESPVIVFEFDSANHKESPIKPIAVESIECNMNP